MGESNKEADAHILVPGLDGFTLMRADFSPNGPEVYNRIPRKLYIPSKWVLEFLVVGGKGYLPMEENVEISNSEASLIKCEGDIAIGRWGIERSLAIPESRLENIEKLIKTSQGAEGFIGTLYNYFTEKERKGPFHWEGRRW